jgi:hypothetical protein
VSWPRSPTTDSSFGCATGRLTFADGYGLSGAPAPTLALLMQWQFQPLLLALKRHTQRSGIRVMRSQTAGFHPLEYVREMATDRRATTRTMAQAGNLLIREKGLKEVWLRLKNSLTHSRPIWLHASLPVCPPGAGCRT